MPRHEIVQFFETSPAAKLLRSDLAAWVVCFLKSTFKEDVQISIGQSELRDRLVEFQRWVHGLHPNVLLGSPDRYLAQWSDALWLKRFIDASSSEPQYRLTPAAEDAIRFVEESIERRKQSIGTEGRLRMILETLQDIVRGSSSDPQKRLGFLRARVDALNLEIASIESGQGVNAYQPSQIRERFQAAVRLLRELQSDFRAVEEQFQTIASQVQWLQSEGEQPRGSILKFALDAEDALKTSDEGVSFFAFVRFLLSPNEQLAVRRNLEELQSLDPLSDQTESLHRMRRMVPALLAEADQVMRTTSRLSTTLRRLLDARASAHRARTANILRDIRQRAMQMRNAPPQNFAFSIDMPPDFQSAMARSFWTPTTPFVSPKIVEHVAEESTMRLATSALHRMQRLDFRKLRKQIREATLEGQECTLQELLDSFPTQIGVADILGYIQIANDDGHAIDLNSMQSITFSTMDGSDSPSGTTRGASATSTRKVQLLVPRIVFQAKASMRPDGGKPR